MTPGHAGSRITWLGLWVNVVLGVVKVATGLWANSRALVADGLHSLTDLVSDAAVLFGLSVAARPPDLNHPYGHRKASSLVTLFLASSLLLFCILLVLDSLRALQAGTPPTSPGWPALAVALGSLGVKEILFRATRKVAQREGSQLLLANAWHHRTDSASSLVASAGIAAALLLGPDWAILDTLVGLGLAAWLAVEGVRLLRPAVDDLMDAAPEQAIVDDLREHILPMPGAVAYHDFRARRVGDLIEVDFHLLVPPEMNIREAHVVAHRVKDEILARHPEVLDVLIHVEPAVPEHHRQRGLADGEL
ncbi:MAG: cation transporter [Gemmatimonadales bacterium]|nr:MAG: cation transporter [Gemmatimonadales bacterium]